MIPTIIESPYAGNVARNALYLELCIRDSVLHGEAPYASHKMMTAALDDLDPEERRRGIDAGMAWRRLAGNRVFYLDLGWSDGMEAARHLYDNERLYWMTRYLGVGTAAWVDKYSGAAELPPRSEWPVRGKDAA
jgi:hypothetical protein